MDRCVFCGTETQLFDSGVPICIGCCDELEAKRKQQQRTILRLEHLLGGPRAKPGSSERESIYGLKK